MSYLVGNPYCLFSHKMAKLLSGWSMSGFHGFRDIVRSLPVKLSHRQLVVQGGF